jgi:hypothetical protein
MFQSKVGNPIDELQSTKLWQRLKEINSSRAEDACRFLDYTAPYLFRIHENFPLYPRHDCHHSYEVLNRMGSIIRDELFENRDGSLSDDEIYCLIIAAYAHDIGMVLFENDQKRIELLEKLEVPIENYNENEKLTIYLREHHAERGIDFLRDTEASKYIPEYLRGLIGLIMKGHNLTPSSLLKEPPDTASIGRTVSNPIWLSIVLCCADALEFSDTRVIDSAYDKQ